MILICPINNNMELNLPWNLLDNGLAKEVGMTEKH